MSYKLIPTESFKRELKKLRKKYPSLLEDLESIESELIQNPRLGKEVYKNCYKIRIAIKSKGKGKSGGGRLVTHVRIENESIFLLSIYDKSKRESITDTYIKSLLDFIP
ncbi:type II toxin-antitoxin system RelE/ParE family toxin [Belliella marina]|uniref:Type II toxin-antitoxin system RelE/ParE family toxin n=1 Tax=Belliella marina TaxID=1644146 RepID=A0ABW4VSC1_9BACT